MAEQKSGICFINRDGENTGDKSPGYVIQSWLRAETTIKFLSLWERQHNDKFADLVAKEPNLTPKIWIAETHAIGMTSRQGKKMAELMQIKK
ncbi:MAG: hypothetical protein L6V93_10015 [Clostridiales bacterium]|nr:MAG: hypothetical protein L6V93_10015 [Clostridiales bacterium]